MCRCPIGQFDLAQHSTVDSSTIGSDGWCPLVKLEHQVLKTLVVDYAKAKALENHVAKLAVDAKASMSGRLRSLLQSAPLARTLWNKVKEAAEQAISPNSLTAEVKERADTIRSSDTTLVFPITFCLAFQERISSI